jgi:hypothetical protein
MYNEHEWIGTAEGSFDPTHSVKVKSLRNKTDDSNARNEFGMLRVYMSEYRREDLAQKIRTKC